MSKRIQGLLRVGAVVFAFQAGAAVAAEIDLGPFCTGECKTILTLKADAATIKGTVAFPVASLTFPYGVALKKFTEEAAAKYFPGIKLIVGDGQNDPTKQTALIDDYIAQKVNVIIVNAVEKDALAPAVKRAMDAGIKVVEVDRTVSAPVTVTIKANDYDIGFAAGKSLIAALNGKGNVVEIQGAAAASPTIDRHKGFMEAIAGSPGVKVVGSNNGDYDEAKGMQVMEDFLTRFGSGKIDAVYTHADMMARGAARAIASEGRQSGLKIISIDGENSTIDMVADGKIYSTTIYPVVAPMDIVAAAKLLAGEPLPNFIKLDSPTVTKANAAEFKSRSF
jgi:ribose transport system substrate-binding protein